MFKLSLAGLLVASVQAQTLISTPKVIISGESKLEIDVTFGTCVEFETRASLFNVFPSSVQVSNGNCQEVVSRQSYKCMWDISAPANTRVVVDLPANLFMDLDGNPNQASQTVSVHYLGPLEAVLRTEPNTNNYPNEKVDFVWDLSHSASASNVRDPFTISSSLTTDPTISSLSYGPMQWEFSIMVPDGETVTVAAKADIATDALGRKNTEGSPITRRITKGSSGGGSSSGSSGSSNDVDCVVSGFGAFTDCTATCKSYSSTFESMGETRTRTRTVITAKQGNGDECPPLTETLMCDVPLCRSGSRPLSGETSQDCSNDCAPFNEARFGNRVGEAHGCFCDQECEANGDCCQGYFSNNCCPQGNCENDPVLSDFVYKSTFPLSCSGSGKCGSPEPLVGGAGGESYYCWCDGECSLDDTCCGGFSARKTACGL